MEIVISALIGAFSAICVALINKKRENKRRDLLAENLQKKLHIDNSQIVIIESNSSPFFKETSTGSQQKTVYIIK
jgi:hypothetical protein